MYIDWIFSITEYPDNWDMHAEENMVVLESDSKEFTEVKQNFEKTIGTAPNLQILEVKLVSS